MEQTEIKIPIISEESVERAVYRAIEKYYSKKEKASSQVTETLERPLSIKDACKFIGISVPTMYSWIKKGRLKVSRIGRRIFFTKSELMKVIIKNLS